MSETEITSERIINASAALLFRAWSEPAHLQTWWGPAGFTNTFHVFDFCVGGHWRLTMHGPDKGNYENESVFTQIQSPTLIAWKRLSQPLFDVEVQFVPLSAERTKVVFKMIFASEAECRKLKAFAPEKNEENFDRLEEELAKM